jgi:hypothetical protein
MRYYAFLHLKTLEKLMEAKGVSLYLSAIDRGGRQAGRELQALLKGDTSEPRLFDRFPIRGTRAPYGIHERG